MNKRIILMAAGLAVISCATAQPWNHTPGGNTTTLTTQWLGNNASSTQPLRLKTTLRNPMEFYTHNTLRMRLNGTNSPTIASWTIKQNGFVGISQHPSFFSGTGPFTRLHLVDSVDNNALTYAQQFGFRPWMRNGITFTGNQDQSYIGQKYSGTTIANDSTDMVIQWSDNDDESPWPTDRLRFLFTDDFNDSAVEPYGATSLEGLESFRIFIPNDTQAYVGVGDFYRATVLNSYVMVDPEERFDVLDGRVRIRQLPLEDPMDTATKMVVVNETGVLGWQDIPTVGSTDCDWEMLNTGTSGSSVKHHVYTAEGASDDNCPDATDNVGIGVIPAASGTGSGIKLYVKEDTPISSMDDIGIRGETIGDDGDNMGAFISCDGTSTSHNYGQLTYAFNGSEAYGLWGQANRNVSGTSNKLYGVVAGAAPFSGSCNDVRGVSAGVASGGTNQYGVKAEANYGTGTSYGVNGAAWSNAGDNYGVYGLAGSTTGGNSYGVYGIAGSASGTNYGVYGYANVSGSDRAGYFAGDLEYTGSIIPPSDAALKENVEPVMGALATITQLQPKTYTFDTAAFAFMNLPNRPQIGLIAQEVQPILPSLVRDCMHPASYDSLGNMINPDFAFKGVEYMQLIPLLIAGIKDQQAQIAQLQTQVAGCCANLGGGNEEQMLNGSGGNGSGDGLDLGDAEDQLKIQPNPFNDATSISYTLGNAGQVRLLVSTMSGKQLQVLEEDFRDVGSYTYEWNTSALAAGMYNVMLLVDGAPLMQKAVKIAR